MRRASFVLALQVACGGSRQPSPKPDPAWTCVTTANVLTAQREKLDHDADKVEPHDDFEVPEAPPVPADVPSDAGAL